MSVILPTSHAVSAAPAATRGIDPTVVGAIARASAAAHVDFGYLMAQAKQESDFQPTARATTSSATGLFQFIESTWLSAVKQYGAKYGLGQYAAQISQDSGAPQVASPTVRRQILALRDNPTISSELAAETANANRQTLTENLGHAPSDTALYLAHFLGAGGATTLVKTAETAAGTKAADLLPAAAAANRAVFYDKATGAAKTVAQIYATFAQKLDTEIANFGGRVGEDSMATLTAAAQPADPAGVSGNGLADLPNRVSGPLTTMMNAVALTALRLVGNNQPADALSQDGVRHDRRRSESDPEAA
jgi:hypothetical protein